MMLIFVVIFGGIEFIFMFVKIYWDWVWVIKGIIRLEMYVVFFFVKKMLVNECFRVILLLVYVVFWKVLEYFNIKFYVILVN